jgi:hypothetical protein
MLERPRAKKTIINSTACSTALAAASASSAQVPINEPDLPKNFNESCGDKLEQESKINRKFSPFDHLLQ